MECVFLNLIFFLTNHLIQMGWLKLASNISGGAEKLISSMYGVHENEERRGQEDWIFSVTSSDKNTDEKD